MDVSVVICTLGTRPTLPAMLRTVAAQLRRPSQVIIVNGGTENRQGEWVVPDMAVDVITASRGLTTQRNAGLEHVTGEIVLFCDDDVLLDYRYIEACHAVFLADETVVGVTGDVINWPRYSAPATLARRVFFLDGAHARCNHFTAAGFPAWGRPKGLVRVDFLSGCNMAYRMSAIAQARFEETWEGYGDGEDVEFSARVGANACLYACEGARLIHLVSPIRAADGNRKGRLLGVAMSHKASTVAFLWAISGMRFASILQAIVKAVRR